MSWPGTTFLRVVLRDALGSERRTRAPQEHLEAAVRWLERAHDAGADGGVSYGYSLRGGWRPPYIETSGYILVTFLDLARLGRWTGLEQRARAIADWLCSVQNPDGSFSNPRFSGRQGIVFDTGQDLLGLVRIHERTGEARYLEAARRAAAWLVRVADGEGRWTRNTFNGIPHVYNSRVAWALLELDRLHRLPDLEQVARVNLDWAIAQQRGGFFEQCAFKAGVPPYTHTIAYAIRGLQESGRLLGDEAYSAAAVRASDAVRQKLRDDGFLPGRIEVTGAAAARYCCLTGNCQMAVIWAQEARQRGCRFSREAAVRALGYVLRHQDIAGRNPDVHGAIKGSQPVWGGYAPLCYPAWATKFFIDAMLRCEEWL